VSALLGVVLVAGVVFAILMLTNHKDAEEQVAEQTPEATEQVENEPEVVTDGGVVSSVDQKEQASGDLPTVPQTDPSTGKKQLQVSVSAEYADGVIRAYSVVYNTVNTSGKCTYTFVSPSGERRLASAEALPNPSTVTCAEAAMPTDGIKGTWQVMLDYVTSSEEGRSAFTPVAVR
jgi:hypothetical protein